jgi:formamidopyrimidine-DNA glycosylase
MSVELPEAQILSEQINKNLKGKEVESFLLKDCKGLQRIGMMNDDITSFDQLVGGKIEFATSRGNVIQLRFDNRINLILCLEYGGKIFYHRLDANIPKFHLRLDFNDGTVLTVRLTSMGVIQVLKDDELERSYVYKRDFDASKLSPIDDEFTFKRFSKRMVEKNKILKSVLVGKDSILVGISNSTFQDILYQAKIYPKRKASELDTEEKRNLYNAIQFVLKERIRLNGKEQFQDLYTKQGGYIPAMGPNMKEQNCSKCGIKIEKMSISGGHVYICPLCQR